ncbi:MAG: GAF domain-containing protein [Chloroflexi bacterium]|nr:GAF domain-containing protein [Chloroflexota bacterium]
MPSPYKILLVEDDHEICYMLSRAFTSLGYDITTANDGYQAMERIEAEYFNVVLLDIMLPGPDGIDILKYLREHSPQTETIMLTAYASLDTAVNALRLGAYDYVTKPFKFDNLRSIIRRALEKQRLETKLDAIYDLSREMALSLNVDQVVEAVLDIIERVLEFEICHLMLVDEERDELYCFAERGMEGNVMSGLPLGGDQGIAVAAARSGEPLCVPDVREDAAYVAVRAATLSELAVPLKVKEHVIGVLNFESAEVDAFSQADVRLCSTLAAQTAVAMENARLYEQARMEIAERMRAEDGQRKALDEALQATHALRKSESAERAAREQAERLRQATTALASTLDLDQTLDSILKYLEQVIPYASASVFLWDQESKRLRIVATRGIPNPAQVIGRDFPADDDELWLELKCAQQPLILANTQSDDRFEKWAKTNYVRGWMGVPLTVRGEIIGCLTLDSRLVAAYDEAAAALAQAFADQAAVAIYNARLFEQVRTGRGQLQALSHRHVEAQEAERARIARELHDETGQALSAMLLGLSLFEREVDRPDAVIARAVELGDMVHEMLDNMHRLAMDLRPASLDLLGLVPAMGQYIETFGHQQGITTHFETLVGIGGERLSPAVETALYRIVQEALTNVSRHAQATHVDVVLERRDGQIVTIVEDDGIGFDTRAAMQSSRLGLFGIRERAEMLDGIVTIESSIGAGTTVSVEIPDDQSSHDV